MNRKRWRLWIVLLAMALQPTSSALAAECADWPHEVPVYKTITQYTRHFVQAVWTDEQYEDAVYVYKTYYLTHNNDYRRWDGDPYLVTCPIDRWADEYIPNSVACSTHLSIDPYGDAAINGAYWYLREPGHWEITENRVYDVTYVTRTRRVLSYYAEWDETNSTPCSSHQAYQTSCYDSSYIVQDGWKTVIDTICVDPT